MSGIDFWMVGMWGFYGYIKFGQLGNLDPHQATVKVTTSMLQRDERKYSGGPAYKLTCCLHLR